jgi:FkbM family methyltransferase
MKIQTPPKIKKLIVAILERVLNRLNNNGNANPLKNGEMVLIKNLSNLYKGKNVTIFDVGAHLGDYTQKILEGFETAHKEIHLFEFQKNCVSKLHERFRTQPNVHINNFGLSDSNEKSMIFKNSDTSELASLYKRNLNHYGTSFEMQEEVQLRTAKEYIQENNISHINLLKIDVEGNELKTFQGFGEFLKPDFVDFIQFEYGGANIDSHTTLMDMFTLLESRGFKIAKIMPDYVEVHNYDPRLENFIYQNYLAYNPTTC